jgi:hypothetical protein
MSVDKYKKKYEKAAEKYENQAQVILIARYFENHIL